MSFPILHQGDNLIIIINNKPHNISKNHITYNKVVEAIKAKDWDTVRSVIDPKKVIIDYGNGNISVKGDILYWKGEEIKNSLAKRIIKMLQEGFDVDPWINFMNNLMQNPSKRAVDEFYTFDEANGLPITEDGCFLAFKKVRHDWFDIYSNTVNNKPGYLCSGDELNTYITNRGVTVEIVNGTKVVSMDRNKVDDIFTNECSVGLHVCSMGYLKNFGRETDPIIIVKVNPADVVSFPNRYENSKGRVCRYEIVSELGVDPVEAFDKVVQNDANHPLQNHYSEVQFYGNS